MRYQVTDLISETKLISDATERDKKVHFVGISNKFVLAIIGNITKHTRAEIPRGDTRQS